MSEERLLDFAAICRSCLNNSVDLNGIFKNGFNDLLLACTDIEVGQFINLNKYYLCLMRKNFRYL